MSLPYNSAARLHKVFTVARHQSPQDSALDAWSKVFNVRLPDPNRRWMALTRKLELVMQELDRIEQQLPMTPLRTTSYQQPLEKLRQVLDVTAPGSQFHAAKQNIDDHVLYALETYASVLPSDGSPVENDDLEELVGRLSCA